MAPMGGRHQGAPFGFPCYVDAVSWVYTKARFNNQIDEDVISELDRLRRVIHDQAQRHHREMTTLRQEVDEKDKRIRGLIQINQLLNRDVEELSQSLTEAMTTPPRSDANSALGNMMLLEKRLDQIRALTETPRAPWVLCRGFGQETRDQ